MRSLIGREPDSRFEPTWRHEAETVMETSKRTSKVKTDISTVKVVYSQVGDASFTHSAGDGLHRRAQRVQQRGQLSGAFCLPALLHDEAGHGDHVGVEGPLFGHGRS